MVNVSLAEELALLAYDDDGSTHGAGKNLDLGLAGALLLELALAGRVGVTDKRLAVIDPTPTGDALIDATLRRIAAERRRRTPKDWVTRIAKGVRPPVLDRLVEAGVLRRETDIILWVFRRTRYPSYYGVEPPVETAARQRMHAAVGGTGRVDPRTAALCGLVSAMGWERRLFRDLPRRQVKARLNEIRQGAWAAEAVKKAIDDVQAAVVAATAAATTAASSGG
jgi:hypothetical protein